MEIFEGLRILVEEITADIVEIDLETKPEDVADMLQFLDKVGLDK